MTNEMQERDVLPHPWITPMPLQQLPRGFDFRLTGSAVSTLQSLAQLCQDDNDAMDAAAKNQALDRAAAQRILMAQLVVRIL